MKIVTAAKLGAMQNVVEVGFALPLLIVQTVDNEIHIIGIADVDDSDEVLRASFQNLMEQIGAIAYALVFHTAQDEIVVSYQHMITRQFGTEINRIYRRGKEGLRFGGWKEIHNSRGPMARLFDNPGDVLL